MDKSLESLEIYQLALSLSRQSREFYEAFDYTTKKIVGMQYIRSIDSVGANIAEGYGRFHYLDSIKFYYNARGSLSESKHRLTLMFERKLISQTIYDNVLNIMNILGKKLNNFITTIKQRNFPITNN